MLTNIWILQENDWDADAIIGVFDSREKILEALPKIFPHSFALDEGTSYGYGQRSCGLPIEHFYICEYEVNKF